MKNGVAILSIAMAVAAPAVSRSQTWTEIGETEIRRLIEAENGAVTEVLAEEEGMLTAYAKMDGWLNVMVQGEDCAEAANKLRCQSLSFNAVFEVGDSNRASALERDVRYTYVADMADGEDYVIHRQVELRGGASLANLRHQLSSFIAVGELIADRIWPPNEAIRSPTGATGAKPAA